MALTVTEGRPVFIWPEAMDAVHLCWEDSEEYTGAFVFGKRSF